MLTLGLIIIFVAMILFDFKKVWKKKGHVEKIVYTTILCIAFTLSELHLLGFKLIGLNQIIDKLIKSIGLSV